MAKVIAITDAFKTLTEVETRFGVSRSEQADFFHEWRETLPALNAAELDRLSLLRQRLLYHRADGDLLEGVVMLLVASPLLLPGYCSQVKEALYENTCPPTKSPFRC
jgi:hypothetical protein